MRFQGIQILRFFCAMGVVLFHAVALSKEHAGSEWDAVPWSHFSNVGVLFFFSISGFVLTQALQRESILRFVVLRILRIYPAFLLAVAIMFLIRLAYGLPLSSPQSPIGYLLLVPDGIGPDGFMLGGIEWTLKHEVFYYLLLALLWSTRRELLVKVVFAVWAIAIIGFTIKWPGIATKPFPEPRYFIFSTAHFSFIAGVFAYLYRDRLHLTAGALTVVLALLWGSQEFFLHTEAKYFCIAMAALLALPAIARKEIDDRRTANRILIASGDGSYGLYLLHVAVQVILINNLVSQQYPVGYIFILLLMTSVAAGLGYGYLESAWYRWVRRKITIGSRRQKIVVAEAPTPG